MNKKTPVVTAFFILLLAAIVLVVLYGSPLVAEKPAKNHYYGSPVPILPMTFRHGDHITENCLDCHHNYRDGLGGQPCMNCHVQQAEVAALLRRQFHQLCRGCHEERAARGKPAGPPRRCKGCHPGDVRAQPVGSEVFFQTEVSVLDAPAVGFRLAQGRDFAQ